MLNLFEPNRPPSSSKPVRAPGFLSFFFFGLLIAVLPVRGAETGPTAPLVESVAPGIWRLHFGDPETFTPTHFRSAAMDTAGLEAMPFQRPMPLDMAGISFQVSARGCSLLLPMKPHENI